MNKILVALFLAAASCVANAQPFAPGELLTSQKLNAALASPTITGGAIDNSPIGLVTPRSGSFTTLNVSGATVLSGDLSLPVTTCTPTVTLVGGAGNTVPVYTTNSCRYTKVGKLVFVDALLTGDGGAEGAGTGQVNIALPIAAGTNQLASPVHVGWALNNATNMLLDGTISAAATTMQLGYWTSISARANFTGDQQNNATRSVRLSFHYEVN